MVGSSTILTFLEHFVAISESDFTAYLTDRRKAPQDQSIVRRMKQKILYQISTTQLRTLCLPFKVILWSQMFIIPLNLMELAQG